MWHSFLAKAVIQARHEDLSLSDHFWLNQTSPDTATADDIRRFQLFLVESGASIIHRNRVMTGVKFLFRVTLRRHDLAVEIYWT
jgi:hypothetical protein